MSLQFTQAVNLRVNIKFNFLSVPQLVTMTRLTVTVARPEYLTDLGIHILVTDEVLQFRRVCW
jgi:hypothetical protein